VSLGLIDATFRAAANYLVSGSVDYTYTPFSEFVIVAFHYSMTFMCFWFVRALCSSRIDAPQRMRSSEGYFLIIQNGLLDACNVVHPLAFAHFKNGITDSKKGEICSPVLWLSPIKSQLPTFPVSGLVQEMQ
jgi:hypothetical protein